MLRVWVWFHTRWTSEDGWFDTLALEHPLQATLIAGVVFGIFEWLLADLLTLSLQPLDGVVSLSLVGFVLVGPIFVWVRRRRSHREVRRDLDVFGLRHAATGRQRQDHRARGAD